MANLFAAEPDSRGWHEVEQTLTALELPPVPPTSETQRLLGYVLQILPRYTEMEMLVTHLRLHASTLEQDMEQVKSHVRLLTREATGEREKKQFLERYAAQVVKERNGLLHSRGSSKQKTTAAGSHFVWHNCCKKNASHAMDMSPSIVSFRGEKLQESLQKVEALQEEVYKQELLRRELDFLLKKTQREHDSRVAADRKHIQQLEKQIAQRSNLHSGLEKKLYETESVLARLDRAKENELNAVNNRVDEAHARVEGLEKENKSLHVLVKRLSDERDRVTQLLEETTESKNVFARRMDELLETCRALESEVEALRSEIDVLQTKDINDIRSQYDARINRLQKDSAAGEEALHQEIDRLKQKLTKRDGSLALASRAQQGGDMAGVSSERHPKTRRSNVDSISLPGDDFKLSDGIFDGDRRSEMDEAELSFTRSELPGSHLSLNLSSASSRQNVLQEETIAVERSFSTQHYEGHSSCQSDAGSSNRGFSRELESISRDLSTSSNKSDTQSRNDGVDTSAFDQPFDWEIFINSVSEISASQGESTTMPFVDDSISEISSAQDEHTRCRMSSAPRHSNLDISATRYDDSTSRMHGSSLDAPPPTRTGSTAIKQSTVNQNGDRSFDGMDGASVCDRGRHEFECDEEEKRPDTECRLVGDMQGQRSSNISDTRIDQEQSGDYQESVREEVQTQSDLVRDLYQMLNRLKEKRKREEQKALQVEQALFEFKQLHLKS